MKTPTRLDAIWLIATCADISLYTWERWMKDATRANKRTINRLVKEHLPDLYYALSLDLRNPYAYFKTRDHLILVHSGSEYFLAYRRSGGCNP